MVTNNRARIKREKSKAYQRLRSERVERSFAHVCETGGARRSWLRGLVNVSKRYLMTVAAHNLALVMRKLFGVGKPKALRAVFALAGLLWPTMSLFKRLMRAPRTSSAPTEHEDRLPSPIRLRRLKRR